MRIHLRFSCFAPMIKRGLTCVVYSPKDSIDEDYLHRCISAGIVDFDTGGGRRRHKRRFAGRGLVCILVINRGLMSQKIKFEPVTADIVDLIE
jgi:hypothetical protein